MSGKKAVVAIVLLTLIGLAWLSDVRHYVTVERLHDQGSQLQLFVEHHYCESVLMFILAYILMAALFLPLAAVFNITAGFLFGTLPGALYINIGATIGATCAFLLVRYLVGDWLQKRYQNRLNRFNSALHAGKISYLIGIHLITVIPFPVINILAGLTNVSLWDFVWTTSVGIVPGSLIYAFAGEQLRTITSVYDVFSYNIILAFVLLAVLAFLPVVVRWSARYVKP